ncbi:MAG: hypothetical protein WD851_03650 [Pirellulales bacterium]
MDAYFHRQLFGIVSALLLAATSISRLAALEVVADVVVLEAQVAVEAGNIDQQLRAQFEPVVKVELSFAIRACKLEGEDRKKLIAAGEEWFLQFIKENSDINHNGNRNRAIAINGLVRAHGTNISRETIAKDIVSVVKPILTPEQAAVYERECEHRENAYREAIAATLVVRMDEKLALSAEQRQKLTEAFTREWNAKWAPPLEIFMYNNDMWPAIPDKIVSPHLTPAQWEIWTRLTKNSQNMHFGGWGLGDNAQVIDDVEFEKPAEQAEPPIEGVFQVVPAPAE